MSGGTAAPAGARMWLGFAALLGALALVGAGIVPAAPAAAAGRLSLDVTRLSAKDRVVSASGCSKVRVHMVKRKSAAAEVWAVDARVRKGKRTVASAFYNYEGAQGTVSVRVCARRTGLGRYELGPSRVVMADWDSAGRTRTDRTKGAFYLRAKARTQLSPARHGRSTRLSVRAQRFDPKSARYTAYSPRARVQAKTGGHWKTVRTTRLRGGRATVTVRPAHTYRVTFGRTSWATGATSRAVRR
ncbi:hypothetical protein GSY69_00780 [Brevibacterium sp. 5221]|uniref:Uncharacterized protein n=1 Tax=Brevibacterium rongguiense TaxID=2695267 RepID=A0A6N9H3F0_9MICO|nr:hypothetical protein [Brevibacterium rongguiense]MYM18548.1 hypothetical protein [Brevibacterium rongguiense]